MLYVLFKPVHLKTLIEALKEILTDVNIEIDNTGMKIIAMDASHAALIHMKLIAGNFEKYHCTEANCWYFNDAIIQIIKDDVTQ